jgi:hypothetical protein
MQRNVTWRGVMYRLSKVRGSWFLKATDFCHPQARQIHRCIFAPVTSVNAHYYSVLTTPFDMVTQVTRFRLSQLHCTALHCTALHCTALHCTALHCTALHCTTLGIHADVVPLRHHVLHGKYVNLLYI